MFKYVGFAIGYVFVLWLVWATRPDKRARNRDLDPFRHYRRIKHRREEDGTDDG